MAAVKRLPGLSRSVHVVYIFSFPVITGTIPGDFTSNLGISADTFPSEQTSVVKKTRRSRCLQSYAYAFFLLSRVIHFKEFDRHNI